MGEVMFSYPQSASKIVLKTCLSMVIKRQKQKEKKVSTAQSLRLQYGKDSSEQKNSASSCQSTLCCVNSAKNVFNVIKYKSYRGTHYTLFHAHHFAISTRKIAKARRGGRRGKVTAVITDNIIICKVTK